MDYGRTHWSDFWYRVKNIAIRKVFAFSCSGRHSADKLGVQYKFFWRQGLGQLESWRWTGRFEREQRSMLTLTLLRHLSAPFQLCIYFRVIADIVDGIWSICSILSYESPPTSYSLGTEEYVNLDSASASVRSLPAKNPPNFPKTTAFSKQKSQSLLSFCLVMKVKENRKFTLILFKFYEVIVKMLFFTI